MIKAATTEEESNGGGTACGGDELAGGGGTTSPDYRGYGLSDLPPQPEEATFSDLIADLLALIVSLNLSKRIHYAESKSDCIAKAEGTYDKTKKLPILLGNEPPIFGYW